MQLYNLQSLYHALPKTGGILDQDLRLLDMMWHAYYTPELYDKTLSEIAKDGALELYKHSNALADLIESWRTPPAAS